MYKEYFKRIFDLLLALSALLVLLPIFILLTLLLSIVNKGEPFFKQVRPGKNGRLFTLLKFRTMNNHCYQTGELLPDESRLTSVGRFIRKTSLDELPQLLNVIKGDMSVVGPRPLLVDYLALYDDFQNRRHEVRPGITGWAQVHGRNAISWDEKFKHDVWYVENLGLWTDIKVILLTIKKVVLRVGINQPGSATSERFTGKLNEKHNYAN